MLKEKENNQNSQKEKQSVKDKKTKTTRVGEEREKCVASQLTGEQHRDHLVVWEEVSL